MTGAEPFPVRFRRRRLWTTRLSRADHDAGGETGGRARHQQYPIPVLRRNSGSSKRLGARQILRTVLVEIHCVDRAAVLIEPVSSDSLPKTGIFAETAGDFWRFPPHVRQRGSPETQAIARKPVFPARFRVSRKARQIAGMRGWRRSANRTRLLPKIPCYITGNFTGKLHFLAAGDNRATTSRRVSRRSFRPFRYLNYQRISI